MVDNDSSKMGAEVGSMDAFIGKVDRNVGMEAVHVGTDPLVPSCMASLVHSVSYHILQSVYVYGDRACKYELAHGGYDEAFQIQDQKGGDKDHQICMGHGIRMAAVVAVVGTYLVVEDSQTYGVVSTQNIILNIYFSHLR